MDHDKATIIGSVVAATTGLAVAAYAFKNFLRDSSASEMSASEIPKTKWADKVAAEGLQKQYYQGR